MKQGYKHLKQSTEEISDHTWLVVYIRLTSSYGKYSKKFFLVAINLTEDRETKETITESEIDRKRQREREREK